MPEKYLSGFPSAIYYVTGPPSFVDGMHAIRKSIAADRSDRGSTPNAGTTKSYLRPSRRPTDERKSICHRNKYKRSIDRDFAMAKASMRIAIAHSLRLQQ